MKNRKVTPIEKIRKTANCLENRIGYIYLGSIKIFHPGYR